ncbi:hypothetical protein C8R43DRAFT_1133991 [Mycena crocata]|nr:hypothetical protein C8R43DRAFT_1133991 [Mycena crocata]
MRRPTTQLTPQSSPTPPPSSSFVAMSTIVPTPQVNASASQEEMDTLLAMVSDLSHMSLDMARMCIEVQRVVPTIALSKKSLAMTSLCMDVHDQIRHSFDVVAQAAAAAAAPPPPLVEWVRRQALTPEQLEASFPPGISDDSPWHVVCIGREPGIYISSDEAGLNVSGVPKGFRKKKDTRVEALAFYRARFEDHKVEKWRDIPIVTTSSPAATASTSAAATSSAGPGPVVTASTPNPAVAPFDPAVSVGSSGSEPPSSGWATGESVSPFCPAVWLNNIPL